MKKIKIRTLQEFNDHFNNHPAVQKALEEKKKKLPKFKDVKVPEGMSEGLAIAIAADKRVGDLVDVGQRVKDCQEDAKKIIVERIKSGKRQPEQDEAFAKKWGNVEKDYRKMVRLTYEIAADDPMMDAVVVAAKDISNVHAFAIPALVPKEVWKDLKGEPQGTIDLYHHVYLPHRAAATKALEAGNVREKFKKAAASADELTFQYAPQHLIQENNITMGGQGVFDMYSEIMDEILSYQRQQAFLEMLEDIVNVLLLIFILNWLAEIQIKLKEAEIKLAELQAQQLTQEAAADDQQAVESVTTPETPEQIVAKYGFVIGNTSPSKRELHLPICTYLSLITPENVTAFDFRDIPYLVTDPMVGLPIDPVAYDHLYEGILLPPVLLPHQFIIVANHLLQHARSTGLDNCHYCIGSSLR